MLRSATCLPLLLAASVGCGEHPVDTVSLNGEVEQFAIAELSASTSDDDGHVDADWRLTLANPSDLDCSIAIYHVPGSLYPWEVEPPIAVDGEWPTQWAGGDRIAQATIAGNETRELEGILADGDFTPLWATLALATCGNVLLDAELEVEVEYDGSTLQRTATLLVAAVWD